MAAEIDDYYFVSFGREQGGLLEFLGLPPDARDSLVVKTLRESRQEVKKSKKMRTRELSQKRKSGEITLTDEEFEAEKKQIDEEANEQEVKLNELKSQFDKVVAEKRELARSGRTDDSVNWQDMYRTFGSPSNEVVRFQPLEADEFPTLPSRQDVRRQFVPERMAAHQKRHEIDRQSFEQQSKGELTTDERKTHSDEARAELKARLGEIHQRTRDRLDEVTKLRARQDELRGRWEQLRQKIDDSAEAALPFMRCPAGGNHFQSWRFWYLDFAELPPDAEEPFIAAHTTTYSEAIKLYYEEQRLVIDVQLAANSIDADEHRKKVLELENASGRYDQEIKTLKEEFKRIQEIRAARESRGEPDPGIRWLEIHRRYGEDPAAFWCSVLATFLGLEPDADSADVETAYTHVHRLSLELLNAPTPQDTTNPQSDEGADNSSTETNRVVLRARLTELEQIKQVLDQSRSDASSGNGCDWFQAADVCVERFRMPQEMWDEVWSFLLRRRAVSGVDITMIRQIEQRWLAGVTEQFLIPQTRSGHRLNDFPVELPWLEHQTGEVDDWYRSAVRNWRHNREVHRKERKPTSPTTKSDENRSADQEFVERFTGVLKQMRKALSRQNSTAAANALASQRVVGQNQVDFSSIADLVLERDMLGVLTADALWSQLRFTNRVHWKSVLAQWRDELEQLGPEFRTSARGHRLRSRSSDYQALTSPPDLFIERLERGESLDVNQERDPRKPSESKLDLSDHDLRDLAELFASLGNRGTDESETQSATTDEPGQSQPDAASRPPISLSPDKEPLPDTTATYDSELAGGVDFSDDDDEKRSSKAKRRKKRKRKSKETNRRPRGRGRRH